MKNVLKKTLLASVAVSTGAAAGLAYYTNEMEALGKSPSFVAPYSGVNYSDEYVSYNTLPVQEVQKTNSQIISEAETNIETIIDQTFDILKLIATQNAKGLDTPYAQYGTVAIETQASSIVDEAIDQIVKIVYDTIMAVLADHADDIASIMASLEAAIAAEKAVLEGLVQAYIDAVEVAVGLQNQIEAIAQEIKRLEELSKDLIAEGILVEGNILDVQDQLEEVALELSNAQNELEIINENITALEDEVTLIAQSISGTLQTLIPVLTGLGNDYGLATALNDLIAQIDAYLASHADAPGYVVGLANLLKTSITNYITDLAAADVAIVNDWIAENKDSLTSDIQDIQDAADFYAILVENKTAIEAKIADLTQKQIDLGAEQAELQTQLDAILAEGATVLTDLETAITSLTGTGGLLEQLETANGNIETALVAIGDEMFALITAILNAQAALPDLIFALTDAIKNAVIAAVEDSLSGWINDVFKPWQDGNVDLPDLEDVTDIISGLPDLGDLTVSLGELLDILEKIIYDIKDPNGDIPTSQIFADLVELGTVLDAIGNELVSTEISAYGDFSELSALLIDLGALFTNFGNLPLVHIPTKDEIIDYIVEIGGTNKFFISVKQMIDDLTTSVNDFAVELADTLSAIAAALVGIKDSEILNDIDVDWINKVEWMISQVEFLMLRYIDYLEDSLIQLRAEIDAIHKAWIKWAAGNLNLPSDLITDFRTNDYRDSVDSDFLTPGYPPVVTEITSGGVTITDPALDEEVSAATYDLSFTISARTGKDYLDFAYDEIAIINGTEDETTGALTGDAITYTAVKGDLLESGTDLTGAEYDVYEYTYTLTGLTAGTEYSIYMQQNVSTVPEEAAYFNDIDTYVKINETPIVHYMPNTITNVVPTINWVDAYATFDITDGVTSADITVDNLTLVTTDKTNPLSPTTVLTSSIDDYVDDGSGVSHVSATLGTGLMPEQNFNSEIFLDGVSIYSADWSTKDWLAPEPPVITGSVDVDSITQHEATIDYQVVVPTADIALGQNQTVIKEVNLYTKDEYLAEGLPEQSLTDLSYEAGTWKSSFDITGLELDTEYTYVIEVKYEGLYDTDTAGSVVSSDITFQTKGLKAPTAPEFDATNGFVYDSKGANSVTFSFLIKDPATLTDTTDTILSTPEFLITTTGGTLTPITSADYTLTYNVVEGTEATDTDSTVGNDEDVWYEGTIEFRNLTPSTSYDFQMGIVSNYTDQIDDEGYVEMDSVPTTIYSSVLTVETLKLPGRLPEWDTLTPFKYESRTYDSLTFSYKFKVPTNDPWYEDTVLTGVSAYLVTGPFDKTELVKDTDYTVTPSKSGDAEGTGQYAGEITFIGLDPNTEYSFQLGIHSTSKDPATGEVVELEEVMSRVQKQTTDKMDARAPWFDATDGIGEATVTSNSAAVDFHFYLPGDDSDYYNTLLSQLVVYTKDTYLVGIGEAEDVFVEYEDVDIEYVLEGDTTSGDKEYSGTVTLNNLPPEDTFEMYLGIRTTAEDLDDGYEDGAVNPEEVYSSVITFETETMQPKDPYWIANEAKGTTGFDFDSKTDTSLTFSVDFMIPEKEHGYAATVFEGLIIECGTSEDTMTEVSFTPDSAIEVVEGENKFKITINDLEVRTEYYVRAGIQSNAATPTVWSETVVESTAWQLAVPPTIDNATIAYDYDYLDESNPDNVGAEKAFILGLDITTGNDATDDRADTTIETIHVGTADEIDKYMKEYVVPESENGVGTPTMHYDLELNSAMEFQTTYDDVLVTVDWSDDGTSYEVMEGSVTYEVPEFTTPDYELIAPEFTSAYMSMYRVTSVDFFYTISVEDKPEDWQSATVLTKLYVEDADGNEMGSITDPETFGEITINDLEPATTYTGWKIKCDYNSVRPSNEDDILNTELQTIEFDLDDFTTADWYTRPFGIPPLEDPWYTLTEPPSEKQDYYDRDGDGDTEESIGDGFYIDIIEEDPDKPVDPVDPDKPEEDSANWKLIIGILIVIILTGTVIAVVAYSMFAGG